MDHKIQSCIILEQIALGNLFGKIEYSEFCQSIVPHPTKMIKFKKFLRENHEI